MKMLAVDDDPYFLELLQAVLASAGLTDLALATSATEAAQIIADAKPPFECCFIDMRMPEIEGDYLCKWIRRLPDYRDTTILMITAKSEKSDIDRAFLAGASDYMTKPMDLAELIVRAKEIARSGKRMKHPGAKASAPAPAPAEGAQSSRIEFTDPIPLSGIRTAIDLNAMEKYLLQLSRSRKYELTACAFKIFEAAKLHLVCSPAEFRNILNAAATAIMEALRPSRPFISYAGYGAFVCAGDESQIGGMEAAALERAVAATLDRMDLRHNNGLPIKVRLLMGGPQKLGVWSGRKVVDAMYRTIGDAEERCRQFDSSCER